MYKLYISINKMFQNVEIISLVFSVLANKIGGNEQPESIYKYVSKL